MTIPAGRVAKEGKASPPGMVLVQEVLPHTWPYLLPSLPRAVPRSPLAPHGKGHLGWAA